MDASASKELLDQAFVMYKSGRLNEAKKLLGRSLEVSPGNFLALRMLGIVHILQGEAQAGMHFLELALEVSPADTEAHYYLGRALFSIGKPGVALQAFERALSLNPEYAEASNAKGIMLSELGRHEEALMAFGQAVQINSGYASAYNNLGNEYLKLNRFEDGLVAFDRAINIQPDFANAFNGRGNVLMCLSRHEEALTSFDMAVSLDKKHIEAWCGRGNALLELHDLKGAIESYECAMGCALGNPDIGEKYGQLSGQILYDDLVRDNVERFGRSQSLLKIAYSIGKTLVRMGRQRDALRLFDQLLAISPDFEDARTGKGRALLDLGFHAEASKTFEQNVIAHPGNSELLSIYLFNLNYQHDLSPSEVFEEHKKYGIRFEAPLKGRWPAHKNIADPDKELRIGFVSADFRSHPIGYFMESVLSSLCQRNVVLFAYANHGIVDETSARLKSIFNEWHDISSEGDEQVAERVRADNIDILVDLSGHTKGNRLLVFARKPAPVQITYLGYFASTGLTAIDYFLGDRWQMPEGETLYYTESPFRLPDHHLCFTPPNVDISAGPLPSLENGYVTFGNFNNADKMNDAVVRCWANILKAVPHSRLFLKSGSLDGHDVAERVYERFGENGIGRDQLVLEGKSSYETYLGSYQRVDIALDPFPYNGGTVTMQSLWMGVPVLTLYGDRHVARHGAGIMNVMGMNEWVATSEEDYVKRAVALASNVSSLADLRKTLRERLLSSTLCDAPRFAHNLELAFREMWQEWCANPVLGFVQSRSHNKQ